MTGLRVAAFPLCALKRRRNKDGVKVVDMGPFRLGIMRRRYRRDSHGCDTVWVPTDSTRPGAGRAQLLAPFITGEMICPE